MKNLFRGALLLLAGAALAQPAHAQTVRFEPGRVGGGMMPANQFPKPVPMGYLARFCQDCNYGGAVYTVGTSQEPGKAINPGTIKSSGSAYDLQSTSAIRIAPGAYVLDMLLAVNAPKTGFDRLALMEPGIGCLPPAFNDRIVSVVVNPAVVFYRDANFQTPLFADKGERELRPMPLASAPTKAGVVLAAPGTNPTDKQVSAVRMPEGVQLTLFENFNGLGRKVVLRGDVPDLTTSSFDNLASSYRIDWIPATSGGTTGGGTTGSGSLAVKNGQYLADACGNKVVLRGVNLGCSYALDLGEKELTEIAKTGANCVRLVLDTDKQPLSGAQLERLLALCLSNQLIPLVELQNFTNQGSDPTNLAKAVQWWTSPDIKAALQKYQRSVLLNVANEPADYTISAATYRAACIGAIGGLRAAGYTCPLLFDAPDGGKDSDFFVQHEYGAAILAADPQSNVLFSVHAYWPTTGKYGNYSDDDIRARFAALAGSGLPVVLGEVAAADVQGANYAINYALVLQQCQQYGLGYLVWWWGFYNNPGADNFLCMTHTGLAADLTGPGKAMATDDANSIRKTSVKACNLR